MKVVLISGGCGFLGTNISKKFLSEGWKVITLDNLKRRGVESNIIDHPNYQFIHGDVRKKSDLDDLPHIDALINLAANPGIPYSIKNPVYDFEVNALGALNMLELARDRMIPIVQASTNKVYSDAICKVNLEETYKRYDFHDYKFKYGVGTDFPMDGQGKHPHSPYGCCYDKDTEILTDNGWKLFKDISDDEIVATVNQKTQKLEYQKITKKYVYDYNGKMFYQKNRRLDILVTPNHNLFVGWSRDSKKLKNPKLVKAEDSIGKTYSHLSGADYDGGEDIKYFELPKINHTNKFVNKDIIDRDNEVKNIDIDKWLKFLGWYLSEGHFYKTKQGNYNVVLTTHSRIEEAIGVFHDLGFENAILDQHHIIVNNKRLYEYVKQFGKSKDKFIPNKIKLLPEKRLRILLKYLMDGDGNKNSKNTYRYTTISEQLANDVSEIATKCGYSTNTSFDSEGFYRVYISSSRTIQCNLVENKSGWINYNGKTYCVSVPNETVMVRRNGKAYFCGNSKASADLYFQEYFHVYGVPTTVFRMSCLYGKHQIGVEDQGWVAWFMIAKLLGKPLNIFGNGKQVRDVLYGDDIAELYFKAITENDKFKGKVFNVGGGPKNSVSLLETIEIIYELDKELGLDETPFELEFRDWRVADHRVYISDIRLLDDIWTPKFGVKEGFRETYKWLVENIDTLRKFYDN